jgi:hypothetical protein
MVLEIQSNKAHELQTTCMTKVIPHFFFKSGGKKDRLEIKSKNFLSFVNSSEFVKYVEGLIRQGHP